MKVIPNTAAVKTRCKTSRGICKHYSQNLTEARCASPRGCKGVVA